MNNNNQKKCPLSGAKLYGMAFIFTALIAFNAITFSNFTAAVDELTIFCTHQIP